MFDDDSAPAGPVETANGMRLFASPCVSPHRDGRETRLGSRREVASDGVQARYDDGNVAVEEVEEEEKEKEEEEEEEEGEEEKKEEEEGWGK